MFISEIYWSKVHIENLYIVSYILNAVQVPNYRQLSKSINIDIKYWFLKHISQLSKAIVANFGMSVCLYFLYVNVELLYVY